MCKVLVWLSFLYSSQYNTRLQTSAQNLLGAFSGGYGGGSGSDCFTIDICPDLLIAGIAAAAAGAFFLIYQGITMAVRRRKRSVSDTVMDSLALGKVTVKYDLSYNLSS